MDNHYKNLIDTLDILMIALCKQKQLGLDPDVNNALKKVTRARSAYKKAYNIRLYAQKNPPAWAK